MKRYAVVWAQRESGLGARTTALPQQPQDLALRSLGEGQRLVAFTPVFARLPAQESAAIAASMVREVFEAGSTVIERDRKSEAMYVVYSGVLSATRDVAGTSQEIRRLCATDHFGAAGVLDGRQSTLKVTALTLAVVYRLEKKDLMRLVEAMPGFAAAEPRTGSQATAGAQCGRCPRWDARIGRQPGELVCQSVSATDSDHVGGTDDAIAK